MIPFQFNVDIISELEMTLHSYKLVVPDFVINELNGIKKGSRGKNKIAASIALKIAKSYPVELKHIELEPEEKVDDALIRISKVLCTNDRELREKARKKGVTVVYLRQRKYLAIDGHIK